MTDHEFDSEDLRRRFVSPPEGASPAPGCPGPEQILQAVLGELPIEKNRFLVDHAAVCPSCAVAFRLARRYVEESGLQIREEAPILVERWRPPLGRRWIPAAAALAAALAVVAVLFPWRGERDSSEPVLRALDRETIESGIPDDARLPAKRFTLRWSPGPEGSRYDIRVTDRRLQHLAGAVALETPEYTVPVDVLSELESGSLVLWQVETVLPDGRRIVAETFATRLE